MACADTADEAEVLCCDVTSPPLAGVITITMKPGYAIEPEWVDYFSDYVLHTTWHLCVFDGRARARADVQARGHGLCRWGGRDSRWCG